MNCREYDSLPYRAIVVHGGPGALGCCAGICKGLFDSFGVLNIYIGERYYSRAY